MNTPDNASNLPHRPLNDVSNLPAGTQSTQAIPINMPASGTASASPLSANRDSAPGDAAELERTRAITSASTHVDVDALLADAQRRREIENRLRALGMSPEEVQRLLNADAHSTNPAMPSPPAVASPPRASSSPPAAMTPMPAPAGKTPRTDMQSMQAYAAELMAQKASAQAQAVEQMSQEFPPFREASMQEVRQAEPLLRDAAGLRRREKYREAEAKVREALLLVPKDAAALELLGDVLQGVARIEEALSAYKRALEADPKRSSAERKYGELLVLQQNWNMGDPEAVSTNTWFALLLSALLPGLGQFHNGEVAKGAAFLALDAVCIYLLAYSPWGFGGAQGRHGLSTSLLACIGLTLIVYIVALVDTNIGVREGRKKRSASGWEV